MNKEDTLFVIQCFIVLFLVINAIFIGIYLWNKSEGERKEKCSKEFGEDYKYYGERYSKIQCINYRDDIIKETLL